LRRATSVAACAALSISACVLGFRGKAAFTADHDLSGVEEVEITLPDTPIDILGCTAVEDDPEACPELLSYRGVWSSLGGTSNKAESNAAEPTVQLVREGGLAALSTVVPLSIAGLVDLEMGTMTMPGDRDVQVYGGVGDVSVDGMLSTVTVVVDVGDVEVRGANDGLAVNTEHGNILVFTGGHADLRTQWGSVDVEQLGGARDLFVETENGDITVTLTDDADVSFTIRAPGTIRIDTPQVTAVTDGSFERTLGTGSVSIELTTDAGGVVVRGS